MGGDVELLWDQDQTMQRPHASSGLKTIGYLGLCCELVLGLKLLRRWLSMYTEPDNLVCISFLHLSLEYQGGIRCDV